MRKYVWGTVAAAVVVLALAVCGVSALRGGDGSDRARGGGPAAGQEARTPERSPAPSPEPVVTSRPSCLGEEVAGVELACLGSEAGPRRADSRVMVVNVWAWWCQPCRQELPLLQDLQRSHPEWAVTLVHADRDGAAGANLLSELGIDLPSYQDPNGRFAAALALPGVIPITLVVVGDEVKEKLITPISNAQQIEQAVDKAVAA